MKDMRREDFDIRPIVTYWDTLHLLDVNRKLAGAFEETANAFVSKKLRRPVDVDVFFREVCQRYDLVPSTLGFEGFPGSLCVSVNDCIAHGVPKSRPFKRGDVVTLDATGYNGHYHSDVAETFIYPRFGKDPDPNHVHLVKTTRCALDRAIRACRPGVRYCDLSDIIYKTAQDEGVYVVEGLGGHGIGRHIHMKPFIGNNPCPVVVGHASQRRTMQKGDVISIEPLFALGTSKTKHRRGDLNSIYTADGSIAAHFERNVIITDSGCEVLNEWRA